MGTEGPGRLLRGLAAAGRRRRVAVATAVAVLVAAGVLVLLFAIGGSGGGAATGPSSSSGATGMVERRTLSERLTATGTIRFAGETTVLARLSGTVTALPAVGDVIRRGKPLYALAGEPVLLMYGSVPAYRTLADGVSGGKDVEQLEANLAALGYEPGTVDEEFTYVTTEAVIAWQEDLGLEASGEIELGRVAFLRGPQRVTKLEAMLGEALAGTGGSSGSIVSSVGSGAGGNTDLVAWRPEDETAAEGEEPTEAPEAVKEQRRELEKLERELEHEREKLEREKARAETEKAKSGLSGQGGAGGSGSAEGEAAESGSESEPPSIPVLRTSSTRRVVSVKLEADQQSIAHRGQKVQVVLPGGAEATGEVIGLASVEASAGEGGPGGEEEEAGIEATISLTGKHRIPALDGATVNVRFIRQVRRHVLSVPLTALVAIGGERFAVHVLGGGTRRQIVVTPGLAANGYVEVRGKGLEAGMRVETGE